MQPLNSPLLWGGLAAAGVAVPIIIHLLYRKHRQQTDWAAMELLRKALVIRSGQVKLEDYLILLLRCLALALIAAALLRPTFNSKSTPLVGEQRVGMVIAIDASYSMNHGDHSRYEKAIAKAREILKTAQQGDPVSLVLMSNRPEILLRRTTYDAESFGQVLAAQKKATPYRLSLQRNLEQLDELVAELKTPARECYLITDAQEVDWASLSGQGRDALSSLTKNATVVVAPVATDGRHENLSINRLAYDSGSLQESGVARFTADVANEGPVETDGGTIVFSVNDEQVKRQGVGPIKPGQTRAVSFFTSFDRPGDVRLSARLDKDPLSDDNTRFAVVNIRPKIRVLCVDDVSGEQVAESRDGAYYAVRALRLRYRGDEQDPMQVSRIASSDLSLEKLDDFDVVLLANVADVSPETVKDLDTFVRRGGGLIVFLGDRVDADLYNKRFDGLLPGKLVANVEMNDGDDPWAMGPVQSNHSLASIVERLPEALLDTARFSTYTQVEPAADAQTILTVAQGASPLLLSRPLERGSIRMYTSSADRSWNNLAVHPLFQMLLQQSVTDMTSHPEERQGTVGEAAELTLPGRQFGEMVQISDPAGEARDAKVIQAGQTPVCPIETRQVGFYAVAGEDDAPPVALAANVDPAESNVRAVDAGVLSGELSPVGVQVVADSSDLNAAIENSRQGRELTNFLLLLGIAVFLAQSFLAKYFTGRIDSGASDVSASLQMSRVAAARRS